MGSRTASPRRSGLMSALAGLAAIAALGAAEYDSPDRDLAAALVATGVAAAESAADTAANDTDGGTQGRVMVDGTIINTGGGAGIMGMTGGYVADIANAQEVNVQISGALGESETGGAAINIIPRTGGNRYSGNWFTSYTRRSFFDTNNEAYPTINSNYPLISDQDVSGAFGGPIKRDRLWFFSVGRVWEKVAFNSQNENIWDNKNAGIWGMNYQPDRATDPLNFTNMTRDINVRVTYQLSQKNKFNFFWDEGLTCQDPCDGAVASWAPRDGNWSGQVHPARLRQLSWTNPLTNRVLLEAGLAVNTQLYDFSYHRYVPGHQDIPRVVEFGQTVGGDDVSPLVNSSAAIFGVQSGNLNNGPGGAAEYRNLDDFRPRASASYITGFVVIESTGSLDVTAVYTTAALDEQGQVTGQRGIDVEQIQERQKRGQPELPDLIPVPDATGSFCRVEAGALIVTVRNHGLGTAGPSITHVDFSGGGAGSMPTPSLAPGQSVDLSFPIPPGCFSPDCGFKITVDANGDVVEANEANNTANGICIG